MIILTSVTSHFQEKSYLRHITIVIGTNGKALIQFKVGAFSPGKRKIYC